MYRFTDTNEKGQSVNNMSIQTTFNGFNLDAILSDDEGSFTTLTVSGRRNTTNRVNMLKVNGMDGAYEDGKSKVEPRNPVVKFKIKDKTNEGFADRLTKLNSLLIGDKKELIFDDEDVTSYATVSELDIPDEDSNDLIGTITFLCSDPFKYGEEQEYLIEDVDTVNNQGTIKTAPVFELEATKKATFVMVTNEAEEYNVVGKQAEVDEKIVDEKTLLIDELGDTVDTWKYATESKGSFKTDSNGIFVDTYGGGTRWHGPVLEKEITPTEDFEIEFYTTVRAEQDSMTFRTSLNFYDENTEDLGLLRVWDNVATSTRKVVEARYGAYTGTNHVHYPISSRNYLINNSRVYNGVVRVKRVGNKFTFYAAHISQRGNHVHTITKTFNDVDNEYAGKLKFIKIGAAIHGDSKKPNALSIQRVRIHKLNKIKVDETPYILYPNDIVTFDHVNEDILINGEPRNDLKDFGGSFFKLNKENNILTVTPEDSFKNTIKYRNKFL